MPHMEQIKASAGSGKTYTLTREFLRALCRTGRTMSTGACSLDGPAADWRSVMAITFTNAAAGEMQDRVLRILKETALGLSHDPELSAAEARHWLDVILRDRSSLNISTIDSLLNLILRLSALGMDLPPDFQPVFSPDDVVKPCWEQYCNEAWQGDPGARRLIADICRSIVTWDTHDSFSSNGAVLRRLTSLVELLARDRLGDLSPDAVYLGFDGSGLLPKLRRTVFEEAARLAAADGTTPDGARGPIVYDKRFATAVTDISANFAAALRALPVSPDLAGSADFARARPSLHRLDSALLGKSEVPVVKKSCPVPADLADAYRRLSEAAADLLRIDYLYSQQRSLQSTLTLAKEIFARCEQKASEEGQVFNDRVPVMVRQVLNGEHGVAEALCRMGTRISHFLVDEFQDTSRDHWEALKPLVVEALSQGGSFSWVGDVKQAIYGFRGGDSQLFDDVADEPGLTRLLEHSPRRSALDMNWRSREEIIAFNNLLFQPLEDEAFCAGLLRARSSELEKRMDVCGDVPELCADGADPGQTIVAWMARKMARAYQGAAQLNCPGTRNGGRVILASFPKEQKEDQDEEGNDSQARAVGAVIRKGRETRPWSDFLVLVRTNKRAMNLARHLTSLGMPVITENSLLVAEHPLIVQTIALLSFLRAPEDDVAFWTLISGSLLDLYPMRGTPADTDAAAGGTPPETAEDSGTEALSASAMDPVQAADLDLLALSRPRPRARDGAERPSLSSLWRQRWPGVWAEVIEPLLAGGATLTPYHLISSWYEHTRAFERWPDAAPFLRRFLEILHTSDQRGLHSLGDFLDFWKEHGGEEKLPMPENLDAVSIMTVHKSKGLQAKVVIVPWTSQQTGGGKDIGVLEYRTRTDGTVLRALCRPNKLFPSWVHDQVREAFEAVNRLYVAFTRAEEELFVFTCEEPSGDGRLLAPLLERAGEQLPVTPWEELAPAFAPPAATGETDEAEADDAAAVSASTPAAAAAAAGDDRAAATRAAPAADTDSAVAEDAAGGQPGPWKPMSWMPGLRLHFAFMDETHPRDLAREEGLFVHGCLESLARLPKEARDSEDAMRSCVERVLLDRSRKVPWLAGREGFLDRCRQEIAWFTRVERRWGWIDNGLPEQTLTRRGRNLRMDLYVPGPGRPVVLDYKTGVTEEAYMEEHHNQVRGYIACLSEAGVRGRQQPLGVVVYLKSRRFHLVLPEARGGGPLALLDEDEFARAMERLG